VKRNLAGLALVFRWIRRNRRWLDHGKWPGRRLTGIRPATPVLADQTLTWTGTMLTNTATCRTDQHHDAPPTIVNAAQIDDGLGNVHVRRAFVNGHKLFLPLILR
jgi:hypothetical protein